MPVGAAALNPKGNAVATSSSASRGETDAPIKGKGKALRIIVLTTRPLVAAQECLVAALA